MLDFVVNGRVKGGQKICVNGTRPAGAGPSDTSKPGQYEDACTEVSNGDLGHQVSKHQNVNSYVVVDNINLSSSMGSCLENQYRIIRFLRYLGFYVSWNKIAPPSTCQTYLGIIIDSELMELRLPPGKLEKMRKLVDEVCELDRLTKAQLDRVTGMLAHCSTIIKGGRTFCRSLYDLYRVMNKNRAKTIRLSEVARSDLNWWAHTAYLFNGKATIAKELCTLSPTSDASMTGFACFFGNDWFYGTWRDTVPFDTPCVHLVPSPCIPECDQGNINVYELYPIYWAIVRWSDQMSKKKVVFTCDNMQVCYMIKTGRSINETCMNWLKRIFWLTVEYDIEIDSEYIQSDKNYLADCLSRLGYDKDRTRANQLLQDTHLCCKSDLLNFCRSTNGEAQKAQENSATILDGPFNTSN